jgi:hypothetical protein
LVVAALLIKAKQQHGINRNKNTGFFYKLNGFCCFAYQNKQKINSSFFFLRLGLDLYIQEIILQKRNETLFFKKRNKMERYFFLEPKQKPKRNKYFSETKRNETKK